MITTSFSEFRIKYIFLVKVLLATTTNEASVKASIDLSNFTEQHPVEWTEKVDKEFADAYANEKNHPIHLYL